MTRDRKIHTAIVAALALCLGAGGAQSGGDDLYGDSQGHPPQVIGIARDISSFKPIAQVRVTAAFKGQVFTTTSDADGRFRIEGFAAGFDADKVEITCVKPGYKPVNVIRRKISSDPNAPVEVECLSQPA